MQIEMVFNKTLQTLTPTTLFNNMLSDPNSHVFAFHILKFFLQFAADIEISVRFIDFITVIIQSPKLY